MIRTFAVIACLVFASGFASAGERSLAQDSTHEYDRDQDSAGEVLRLQRMILEIKERQVRVGIEIVDSHRHRPHPPLPREPQIGDVKAVVVIEKDGYAAVQHTIAWNQYAEDDLDVTVEVSDPALVVPEKLVLDFEKHQFRFEYQVKAGDKTGEFTVTLTPKVGKPVVVKVLVK